MRTVIDSVCTKFVFEIDGFGSSSKTLFDHDSRLESRIELRDYKPRRIFLRDVAFDLSQSLIFADESVAEKLPDEYSNVSFKIVPASDGSNRISS